MSVVSNFESLRLPQTLRLKMCMDVHSPTAMDGGGSMFESFA